MQKTLKLNKITISESVNIQIIKKIKTKLLIRIVGPLGYINHTINLNKNRIVFSKNQIWFFEDKKWRLDRVVILQHIRGVSRGYNVKLKLLGMGYKIILENDNLATLHLGYSHLIKYKTPNTVTIHLLSKNEILLKSINLKKLNQTSAVLRSFRKVDPYKGKGITLLNEKLILKEGKSLNR